jgi:hypothetical protein
MDLPLEDIDWQLFFPESWSVNEWKGNLRERILGTRSATFDREAYLEREDKTRKAQVSAAESLLKKGSQMLQGGRQEQARKAFSSAYNLSRHDAAFNEDARVQLQELREKQALVGLANRRNRFLNDKAQAAPQTGGEQASQTTIAQGEILQYTDRMAAQVLDANTAEENAAFQQLAHRIIRQQQSTLAHPQALLVVLPEKGQSARFTRSIQIKDRAELKIELTGTRRARSWPWGLTLLIVLTSAGLLAGIRLFSRHVLGSSR